MIIDDMIITYHAMIGVKSARIAVRTSVTSPDASHRGPLKG